MKITLLNNIVYNGTIEKETETTIKIRVDETETVILNKRLIKNME